MIHQDRLYQSAIFSSLDENDAAIEHFRVCCHIFAEWLYLLRSNFSDKRNLAIERFDGRRLTGACLCVVSPDGLADRSAIVVRQHVVQFDIIELTKDAALNGFF